jgi:hypothetical protein
MNQLECETLMQRCEDYDQPINKGDSGMYADVYEHPDDPTVVVRIAADQGHLAYVQQIFSGVMWGPHLPVLYAVDKVDDKHITVMERLVHLDDTMCEDDTYADLQAVFGDVWSEGFVGYTGEDDYDQIREIFADMYDLSGDTLDLLTDDFIEAYDTIVDMGQDLGYCADLHDYNVMVRESTGELVITDPWC